MTDQKQPTQRQELAVNVNLDTTPILYTDSILMTTYKDGLVLDVCQKLSFSNQLRIVSRIGMSRDHAKRFLQEMGKLMIMSEGQLQTGEKAKN